MFCLEKARACLIILVLSGCDIDTNFSGENDNNSEDANTSDADKSSSDSEGSDHPTEPVMVGGSYLSCVEIIDRSVSDSEIACSLRDEVNHRPVIVSEKDLDWLVSDELGQSVEVLSFGAKDSDSSFQRYFVYFDNSYLNHLLRLIVHSPAGDRSYSRPFANLPKIHRGSSYLGSSVSISSDLEYAVRLIPTSKMGYKVNPFQCFIDPENCDFLDLFETELLKENSFCEYGLARNEAAIRNMVNPESSSPTFVDHHKGKIALDESGTLCIYWKAPFPQITQNGGCLLLPIVKDKKLSYYLVESRALRVKTKTQLNAAAEFLVEKFKCD